MTTITYLALSLILIIAILYAIPLFRINSLANSILKVKDIDTLADVNIKFKELEDSYESSKTIINEGIKKTFRHASDFYNMTELARVEGVNLRHIHSAPGVLSGLGVLGTFVGLTISVENFDSSDSAAIMTSIKSLLSGMGTAFLTSLVGMLLSAAYIWMQKFFLNKLDNTVTSLTNRLDRLFYISPDELVRIENEKNNLVILERLKSIEDSLTVIDEEGNSISMSNMALNLYEEAEKQSQALESFTTDLSNELNVSLGKTMDTSIVPLIQNLERSHETMNSKIDELAANIQSPATDFVATAVGELQNSMMSMADEFRETISAQTVGQMEKLADSLAKSGDLLVSLPQTMQTMADRVAMSFTDVKNIIGDLQKSITQQQNAMIENARLANSVLADQMKEQLRDTVQHQHSVLVETQAQFEAAVKVLTEQLAKTTAGFAEQQNVLPDTLQSMTDKVSASFNEIDDIVGNLQSSMVSRQIELQEASRVSVNRVTDEMGRKFDEMTSFQQSVLTKMGEQLDTTIQSLTTQLERALSGLNEQQSSLADTHTRSSREIERLLQSFAQSIATMHSANTESADMLVEMKNAGENLNVSTERLKELSASLGNASETIINQQNEAVSHFEEMQLCSQSIIDQLEKCLAETETMVKGYVQDCETIKSGLKSIFKDIDEGLKDYSSTLRESTGNALAEYADAMTKSTAGLKSIADTLNDNVEELSDDIDKLKSRR